MPPVSQQTLRYLRNLNPAKRYFKIFSYFVEPIYQARANQREATQVKALAHKLAPVWGLYVGFIDKLKDLIKILMNNLLKQNLNTLFVTPKAKSTLTVLP